MSAKQIKCYGMYWVNLDPTIGKEMKKTRPCVVVSPDVMNVSLGTVVVVPLTSTIIDWPFRLTIRTKKQVSSAACDQIRTVSKQRIGNKIGQLSRQEQQDISRILQAIFTEE